MPATGSSDVLTKPDDMPVFELGREILFPDPSMAERDGLLAVGGDLSPGRLLSAYSLGIFPWYSEGDPILWWSPDPRLVLIPGRFRVSHSLRQKLSKNQFRVTFDRNFREVIEQCSKVGRRDQAGTWITPEMTDAYVELHRMGYAHSVECFHENELAGGLYGVSLGNAFFGESMFYRVTDASKIALYHLVERMKKLKFLFIDAQVETRHLLNLGAELIPRMKYLELLEEALRYPTRRGNWGIQDAGD